MARKDDLQFFADSALIRKIELIDRGLRKEAGLLDSVEGLAPMIQGIGKSIFPDTSAEGILSGLGKMLEAGFLASKGGMGLLASAIESLTGFSFMSVLSPIISSLIGKVKSGQPITTGDVNEGAAGMTVGASLDYFSVLRGIEKNGQLVLLVKNAQLYKSSAGVWDFLKSVIFGTQTRGEKHSFGVGLVLWLVKNLLRGAGILAIGGAVSKAVGLKGDKKEEKKEEVATQEVSQKVPYLPTPIPSQMKPSGYGETAHNTKKNIWWYPISGSVKDTVLDMAQDVYPELEGKEKDIVSSPAFNRVVNVLEQNRDKGYIEMPQQITSIRDLVDLFAGEVEKNMNKGKIA